MANRSARLITKRTSVPGKIPTGTTGSESNLIQSGELASNLADRKLFGYDGTDVFEYGSNSFLGLTGGTINGNLEVANIFTASTFYSGGTPLETIITNITNSDITRVQPGTNTTTGGTDNFPTINLSNNIVLNSVYAVNISGSTVLGNVDNATVTNNSSKVLTGSTISGITYEIDQALLRARSTGLQYGGQVSIISGVTVHIDSGHGGILNNSDTIDPSYHVVNFSATDMELSGGDGLYYVYVDSSGTINYTTTSPSHNDYRLNIWLSRISITSGSISGLGSILMPLQQCGPQIWDVWKALGLVKKELFISGNANLTFGVTSGEIYSPGSNFYTDPLNPHEVTYSAETIQTFRMATSTGTIATDITNLPVTQYAPGGVVTAIPGSTSRATIFTVYKFPQGNVRVLYGDNYYTSITNAFTALSSYFPNPPGGYSNAIIIGYIIATKGATDLSNTSDASFVITNKFGGVGGAISASLTGYLQSNNNLSDLDNVSTARTNLGLDDLFDTKLSISGGTLTGPIVISEYSGYTTSSTVVDWGSSSYFEYVVTGNTSVNFSNENNGQTIVVAFSNDNIGGYNLSFSGETIRWNEGLEPTFTTTSGVTDVYTFVKINNNIYGSSIQNMY